ncbi:hypothetical protein V8D89_001530 [Ganoderma adspersum]
MATSSSGSEAGILAELASQVPLTYGALLVGTFLGFVLYGLFLHQTYQYFRRFSADPAYISIMVILVLLLETVHLVITAHLCYFHLVTSYFKPATLGVGGWSLNILPVISGITIVLSQMFSIRRVSLIGPRQAVVAVVVSLILLVEIGFSIASTVSAFNYGNVRGIKTVTYLAAVALGLISVADAILTATLVIAMRKTRAEYDRKKMSESMPDIIQIYFVNAGILTGIFNLIATTVAFTRPKSLLLAAISIVVARLYGNTLLAILNSRQLHGMELFAGESVAISIARARREASQDLWSTPRVPQSIPAKIDIKVTTQMDGQK